MENGDRQYEELLLPIDEMSSQDFEASYSTKTYLLIVLAILASATAGAVAINHSSVAANQVLSSQSTMSKNIDRHHIEVVQDIAMVLVFVLGYAGIIFEKFLPFNKSGVGLLMAVLLWVIRSIGVRFGAPSTDSAVSELSHATSQVGEIVFFLIGAMTVVELVDAHRGFKLVTDKITTRKPKSLLWVVGSITFVLSSILDNLTTTIVIVSLLQKLLPPSEYRKILGAAVVIAANAGGSWTPIGDVTTTMLWMNGRISAFQTMKNLFIPSALSLIVPLALMSHRLLLCPSALSLSEEVDERGLESSDVLEPEQLASGRWSVFAVGIGAVLFVPVFKAITGLPPYMGMLLGLGVLWILTDAIHYGESNSQKLKLKVPGALSRIDTPGVIFFLGILLSVSSLEAAGILRQLANYLNAHIPNIELIPCAIGIVCAAIDNIPLVAATIGMYDLSTLPEDAEFWQLIAYCAGTGGSILVIGSAAGVALMGKEEVDFLWYLKKVSGFALAGYAAGIAAFLALKKLHI